MEKQDMNIISRRLLVSLGLEIFMDDVGCQCQLDHIITTTQLTAQLNARPLALFDTVNNELGY
eukprot:scaffold8267_cov74-Cyclotella_meneghiniana.AAC.2